jgi:hypothetical protein
LLVINPDRIPINHANVSGIDWFCQDWARQSDEEHKRATAVRGRHSNRDLSGHGVVDPDCRNVLAA